MKRLFHAQMDLLTSATRLPELLGADRQKAVALLRALLMEAVAPTPLGRPTTLLTTL